ncbi:hypothetical protein L7F22_044789 [Adiantum nelumboides]|nr:hypothetical protein [Adiantum nelumboides]
MEVDKKLDVHDQEMEVWLHQVGLYDYACLPWALWERNEFAKLQLCQLRENASYNMPDKDVSPKLVAEVFKVAQNPLHKVKKVTDAVMRAEFGLREGSQAYYMVRNCGKLCCAHLFWYLDRVCLLEKIAYMSKEAFALVYYVERGQKVDWMSFIFDRLQLSYPRDKRRSPSIAKLAPYLQAIFSHVLQVPLTPTPLSFVKSLDVQNLSDVKRQKLNWDMLSGDKLKFALGQGGKSIVGTDGQGQSSRKAPLFLSMTNLPKIDTKSRTITLFPRKASEGAGEQLPLTQAIKTSPFVKSASAKVEGVLIVQDAVQSLSDLNRFICNQETIILTLETQTAERECIDSLEFEVAQSQSRVEEIRVDGLKEATKKQFHEVEDKISHLIADNNFSMNRLTPLIELEKATLDGQGVTGVLISNANVDVLKKEHKICEEIAELRARNADMEMKLESIRKELLEQQMSTQKEPQSVNVQESPDGNMETIPEGNNATLEPLDGVKSLHVDQDSTGLEDNPTVDVEVFERYNGLMLVVIIRELCNLLQLRHDIIEESMDRDLLDFTFFLAGHKLMRRREKDILCKDLDG